VPEVAPAAGARRPQQPPPHPTRPSCRHPDPAFFPGRASTRLPALVEQN
jgi:hypothetical protein